eukprot:UN27750
MFDKIEKTYVYNSNNIINVADVNIVFELISDFIDRYTKNIQDWPYPYSFQPDEHKDSLWQCMTNNQMICKWENAYASKVPYIIHVRGCRLQWMNTNYVLARRHKEFNISPNTTPSNSVRKPRI